MPDPILPDMIAIPAGQVWMGAADADPDAQPNEWPSGWVDVPAFVIARTPVTVEEFARFVHATPATPRRSWGAPLPAGRALYPAVNISWDDATAYCAWLAAQSGRQFRLPTEAEWERAARGTTAWRWPWGDHFDPACANTCEAGRRDATPVDAHPDGASPFGILDMAGNAWEWTADIYRPYPYTPTLAAPMPETTESRRRVLRGGAWTAEAGWARCSARVAWRPFYVFSGQVGFRVAWSIEAEERSP